MYTDITNLIILSLHDALPISHHDAVHEGNIGFCKFRDAGVEDVLLAPQDLAEIAVDLRAFIERPDIAACAQPALADRKSTRLNSSHVASSYAVFCLNKKRFVV